MPGLYVVGDVHGHLSDLRRLLRDAGLIDDTDRWTGGEGVLAVLGDMVDRGADGIGVLDLIMELQSEAPQSGGQVHAVLGNHEVQLLAASRLGTTPRCGSPNTFDGDWHRFGGVRTDLERLESRHLAWLTELPTMVRVDDDLLVHADATFYAAYGGTIDEVNTTVMAVLRSQDACRWDRLLRDMLGKRAFQEQAGADFLDVMLGQFGARRLIHGHSPIAVVTGQPPRDVRSAYLYAQGRCVNVDHGLYLGGPGFVFTAHQTQQQGD
jgi:hypothetical protein